MAPRLQWSVDLVSDEYIVPRLEDHLIDELFYQEDEIGEMRHTAFMVECGLEEDPPDGPDVPPVPWGDMLSKQQPEKEQKKTTTEKESLFVDDDNDSDSDDGYSYSTNRREKRELPNRSRSTDDIDTLAIELTLSHKAVKKRPPMRSNSTPAEMFVDNSPSSYVQFSPSSPGGVATEQIQKEDRRPPRRIPTKTSPETPPKRKAPVRGGLTKTRSGTTHEMAKAASRARKKMNQEATSKDNGPTYRKLTKTTSGTCREMANAAAKARKKMNAEKAKKKAAESTLSPISSPSVAERRKSIESIAHKSPEKKGRPAPLVRSLVATKSGTKHGTGKSSNSDDESGNSDYEDETPKIVYKNGKRTAERRRSSVSRDSRLKSRSNASSVASDSGSDREQKKIVYRNGKRESIKQYSSFSDSSVDDDHFLGDIIQDSDDDARSEISISTCGSDIDEIVISPPKGQKAYVPKSIQQPLKIPIRQRSVSGKSASDDYLSDGNSPKSVDLTKKKKKKKKKKQSDGLNDDSKDSLHDSFHSTKSIKKKKKKKEKGISSDDTKDKQNETIYSPKQRSKKHVETSDSIYSPRQNDSIYSPRQRSKKSESVYGDLQPGCYPSPSSIRSQNRKTYTSRKSSPDDASGPSIINIGSPGFYGSPSAIKSENRKRFSPTKKSSPFEPQSPSPSIIEIARQQQGDLGRPNDFICTDPLAAIKKKKEQEKAMTSSPLKSPRVHSRPDDWIGSGKKATRTWRVKTKPT